MQMNILKIKENFNTAQNFFMVVVLLITSDIVKDTFQGNHLGYG